MAARLSIWESFWISFWIRVQLLLKAYEVILFFDKTRGMGWVGTQLLFFLAISSDANGKKAILQQHWSIWNVTLFWYQKKNLLHFIDLASTATAPSTHFYRKGNDNSAYFQVLLLEERYLQNRHQFLGNTL